ncbi:neuferricin-like [Artemia franciscana]|uniref:neuferricin-like n=1 Tax=Artemia franciscana TaxID=6661 RepID=UPI0024C8060B|nr:EOG090X0A5G [Artemia franciscana]
MALNLKFAFAVLLISISASYFFDLSLKPRLKQSLLYLHNQCLKHDWCKRTFSYIHGTPSEAAGGNSIDPLVERIFTTEELSKFTGEEGEEVYIALLGKVFNVTRGAQHYGPGGGYHFFAGRDASRAFVSGDFENDGLTDDIEGLSPEDFLGLEDWSVFYENSYQYIGKVAGRFYNNDGSPTEYWYKYQQWREEALKKRILKDEEMAVFPPCNMEWKPDIGTRVWCTTSSGGIRREWVGVPRKLFKTGSSTPRCACIKDSGPPSSDPDSDSDIGDLGNPNLKEYKDCKPTAVSCNIGDDN